MTDLYLDFLCPYAWRGVELASALHASDPGARAAAFRLRHYSLAEGNHPDNANNARPVAWHLTALPLSAAADGPDWQEQSLRAFLAAQAAARQGNAARWTFTLALLRARHEARQELSGDTFQAAARQAAQEGHLDLERWAKDHRDDHGLRAELRSELDAAREVGVFGTPTFVLEGGAAAYYRFEHLTRDPDAARDRWALYRAVLDSDAGIATIKRARNRPAK